MAEDKNQINQTTNNGAIENTPTIIKFPDEVSKLISEKHDKIGSIVDIDLELEETSLYRIFKRASRDYIYGVLGITIEPIVFSQITETLIKQRQILDSNEEANRIKKVKVEGSSDNYKLEDKKAA